MIDQIRDALIYYDRTDRPPMPAVDPLAEGARRYAAGTSLTWCHHHASSVTGQKTLPTDLQVCDYGYAEDDGDVCEIVEKWISDPPENI